MDLELSVTVKNSNLFQVFNLTHSKQHTLKVLFEN